MLRLQICVWLSVLLVWPVASHATGKIERESLRGLKGVRIVIESLSDNMKAFGLTKQQLRTDVEVKLRSAGIPVPSLSDGYLYIRLNGIKINTRSYAFHYLLEYRQSVILGRNRQWYPSAGTWHIGEIISAGLNSKQFVYDSLKGLVDKFINDYLTVNPHSGSRPILTSSTQRDLILRAQEHLKALGYKPGPVDGILGGKTRDALRQYQAAKELPITGDLGDATKKAMGLK